MIPQVLTTTQIHALSSVQANPGDTQVNRVPHINLLECERKGWIRQDNYLGYHMTPDGEAVWRARR